MTMIDDVKIKGIHLKFPGYYDGPTLEIFGYKPDNLADSKPSINRQGLAHPAFHGDSVEII